MTQRDFALGQNQGRLLAASALRRLFGVCQERLDIAKMYR